MFYLFHTKYTVLYDTQLYSIFCLTYGFERSSIAIYPANFTIYGGTNFFCQKSPILALWIQSFLF